MKKYKKSLDALSTIFLNIRKEKDVQLMLEDLLTPKEIVKLHERIQIFQLLAEGIPHREIKRRLKTSIALVTRGSHAFQKSRGGFLIALNALKAKGWRKAA